MIDYSACPSNIRDSMQRYIEEGIPPGDFLLAFLSNDLMDALGRADWINIHQFKEIGEWLFMRAPMGCYGSPENVRRWLENKAALRELTRLGQEIDAATEGK